MTTMSYTSGTSLGRQQHSGYISLIMNFNPDDRDSMASEMLVPNQQTTWHKNPGNHNFCFPTVKTLSYASGTSLGRQQCSEYISLIRDFNPEDEGSMASETLVSNHQTI
jgi:hypothetical protein